MKYSRQIRKFAQAVAVVVVGFWGAAAAQATEVGTGRTFGLGFAVGSPTGIVGKYFLSPSSAIDMGIGFGGWGGYNYCYHRDGRSYRCGGWNRSVSLNADYLWQDNLVRSTAKLDWHIGVGGRVWFWNYGGPDDGNSRTTIAARMPLGLDLSFNRPDFIEVFVELVPTLWLVPDANFGFDAALGVRFFF